MCFSSVEHQALTTVLLFGTTKGATRARVVPIVIKPFANKSPRNSLQKKWKLLFFSDVFIKSEATDGTHVWMKTVTSEKGRGSWQQLAPSDVLLARVALRLARDRLDGPCRHFRAPFQLVALLCAFSAGFALTPCAPCRGARPLLSRLRAVVETALTPP